MKLTVCFGQVKVIVPCGDGDLTVKDLIEKATSRYIKASLQVCSYGFSKTIDCLLSYFSRLDLNYSCSHSLNAKVMLSSLIWILKPRCRAYRRVAYCFPFNFKLFIFNLLQAMLYIVLMKGMVVLVCLRGKKSAYLDRKN